MAFILRVASPQVRLSRRAMADTPTGTITLAFILRMASPQVWLSNKAMAANPAGNVTLAFNVSPEVQ